MEEKIFCYQVNYRNNGCRSDPNLQDVRTQEHYQSVWKCKKRVIRYKAVTQEHVQLLHDGNNY